MKDNPLVIGVDFGSDSVRSVVIDAGDGKELGSSTHFYSRWKEGRYCDPRINQFRQHPLDYVEGVEITIREALSQAGDVGSLVKGLSVDTTGSTPVAVDRFGTPLALTEGFEDNPNAMFVLWKDHTAIREAEEINALCADWDIDYSKYVGGVYSSEWFWAKILHVLRADPQIRERAYSWVEHCDWIPYLLTGENDVGAMKRSRCAAGHKALWHPEFDGLPPEGFFNQLDPLLSGLRDRLFDKTYTSDVSVGNLSAAWAEKLGLTTEVLVGVGAFDAHMGAVGGMIEPYHLSKVMGTSTCDMLVAPSEEIGDKLINGICGQVDGSIIPGMLGMEAGQSAFGDVYAWFTQLLSWPIDAILADSDRLDESTRQALADEVKGKLMAELTLAAEKVAPGETSLVALDWLNGRRTPDADQSLKGAITGLNLGSNAPSIFRALVEATCFGAKKIVDRFIENGVRIDGVIALGGVARKSPFIMQTMADVLDRPIKVARSEQTCALGAAMFAATVAGLYPSVEEAKLNIGQGFDRTYTPNPEYVEVYRHLYHGYQALGSFVESQIHST